MTNTDHDNNFILEEIANSVAIVYKWKDYYLPEIKKDVSAKALDLDHSYLLDNQLKRKRAINESDFVKLDMGKLSKSLEEIIFDLIELFRPHIYVINSVLDIGTGPSLAIHIFADIFPQVRYYTVDVADYRKRKKLPFAMQQQSVI